MAEVMVGLRRGLPRDPGGEPWPVVDGPVAVETEWTPAAPAPAPTQPVAASVPDAGREEETATAGLDTIAGRDSRVAPADAGSGDLDGTAAGGAPVRLRRGLPRVSGGDSWPPASEVLTSTPLVGGDQPVPAMAATPSTTARSVDTGSVPAAGAGQESPVVAGTAIGTSTRLENRRLRQGLPRRDGGGPWPPVTEVQVATPVDEPAARDVAASAAPVESAAPAASGAPAASAAPAASTVPVPGPKAPAESRPDGPRPAGGWLASLRGSLAAKLALAAVALVVVAAAAVLASRWFLATGAGQSFLQAYPGEYHLPESAPVGFPAWLGWQHFLNLFLMVLVIRSGITIRSEKRPAAYWTPRGRSDGKVSLTIFFHQSLDILWLVNGAVFIVLLFASGQWMRVVPTSWEVFPNAVSAALQYMALDWPTDNGWVNYNSLQQLAYFTTIFVAAPLAAATGLRMSALWPEKATRLSKAYPLEWARAIHFPVMIYFVAFITIHVLMVMSTGALRNLNHMYATQGSTDPTAYASNWLGFWMFVLSLAVIAVSVAVTRPFVVAQVAKLFGTVSSR